ncbi:hypothetical protein MA16_Dca002305 [Dendrobium catenatum]|uniref:Uncharacterized protein n=1 Tax=Dendrobium catenatum TaxID=906689 RepID=A0A2I0W058_9ASPA|nr:hypothetical protein MA16_Dca002305 [Dendrobium catenatum]
MVGPKSGDGWWPSISLATIGGLTVVGQKSSGGQGPSDNLAAGLWSDYGWAEFRWWSVARGKSGGQAESPVTVDGGSPMVVLELLKPKSSHQSPAKGDPFMIENADLFIDFLSVRYHNYGEDMGQV